MGWKIILLVAIAHLGGPREAECETIHHTLNIRYVENKGQADGVLARPYLTANDQFPGPLIGCTEGDTLIVTVVNNMKVTKLTVIPEGSEGGPVGGIAIHWHGIEHSGSAFSDGMEFVTQCPIPVGGKMVYNFTVHQAGAFWWHAHTVYHYTEGLFGPLIIQPNPHSLASRQFDKVDEPHQIILILSDWNHKTGAAITAWFLSPLSGGNEPIPDSVLFNGVGNYSCQVAKRFGYACVTTFPPRAPIPFFWVTRGQTYLFHLINAAAFTVFDFHINQHELEVISVDGNPVKFKVENKAHAVTITPAQRYTLKVRMDQGSNSRHWMVATVRKDMFPEGVNINDDPSALANDTRAILAYEDGYKIQSEILKRHPFQYRSIINMKPPLSNKLHSQLSPEESPKDFINANQLTYAGGPAPRAKCEHRHAFDSDEEENNLIVVYLILSGQPDDQSVVHLNFNGLTYSTPNDTTPLLVTVIQGQDVPITFQPFWVGLNKVVQIVVNNIDGGGHPLHLHGHHFWVMGTGTRFYSGEKLNFDGLVRDTVFVEANSWIVIRFWTDNPGVWLFHCHIQWHALGGLSMSFIEGQKEIRKSYQVGQQVKKICEANGIHLG